jgi:hypothetical protein
MLTSWCHVAEIGCVRSGWVFGVRDRSVVFKLSALVVEIEPSGRHIVPRELPQLVVGVITPIPPFPEVLDDQNRAWVFPPVRGGTGSGRPGGLLYLGEVVSVESAFGEKPWSPSQTRSSWRGPCPPSSTCAPWEAGQDGLQPPPRWLLLPPDQV